MGYSVGQGESHFFVHKDNIERLMELVLEYADKNRDSFAVDNWEYDMNVYGDCIGIEFNGEKLNDDYEFFCAIQSIVAEGSFITMHGEDGDVWRWVFKDGRCGEIHAKFSFDE